VRKFIQNILAASVIIVSTSTVYAQYGGSHSSGGYYSGSTYGSSVSYGYNNEIITNFTSGHLWSGKPCSRCDSGTDINVEGRYLRTLNSNVQVGGDVDIHSVSGGYGESETMLSLVGIGVYNFDTNFKQAFFAEGGIGIYPVPNDKGTHDSKFGFFVGGGKRFPLWDRISYIPTLDLVKKGDLDIAFDIEFLNFSFMF